MKQIDLCVFEDTTSSKEILSWKTVVYIISTVQKREFKHLIHLSSLDGERDFKIGKEHL
jgi:hypothetical protein